MDQITKTISISAPAHFSKIVITPIILKILQESPDLSINMTCFEEDTIIEKIKSDIAISINEHPEKFANTIQVGTIRKVLCASPDYLDKKGRPQSPEDLKQYDIINFTKIRPANNWYFKKDEENNSHHQASRLNVNLSDIVISLAIAGYGITCVHSYMISHYIDFGALEIVLKSHEPPAIPVYISHQEKDLFPPGLINVIDDLVKGLKESPLIQ